MRCRSVKFFVKICCVQFCLNIPFCPILVFQLVYRSSRDSIVGVAVALRGRCLADTAEDRVGPVRPAELDAAFQVLVQDGRVDRKQLE